MHLSRAALCGHLRLLVIIAALLLLATASVLPAAAQETPSAPAAPPAQAGPAGPVTAVVRLFLHDILKFDATTGFTADVFLGVGCAQDCGDIGLVVDNGRATSKEVLLDTPQRKGYRMELALTDKVDLHRYPFDVQTLSIVLLSSRPGHEFQFGVDREGTRVGDIRLQGWQVDPRWEASAHIQPADEFSGRPRPTYRFSIEVQRPFLAGFFKVILPGLAILLIGSLGLVVGPDERMKRFDLFNAAFLGTVLFQLGLISSLPPLSYLTFADRFLLINLLAIIVGVVSSVLLILAFRAGKKARAWAIHEWTLVLMPLLWIVSQSANFLLVHIWDSDDPQLWAVLAAEVVVGAAVLAWYGRRMHLRSRFRSAYARILQQTRSPKEALVQTLDIFASEPPLHSLSRTELDSLVELFAPLPDPAVLADILHDAQRTRDLTTIRDTAVLRQFAERVQAQRAPSLGAGSAQAQTAA